MSTAVRESVPNVIDPPLEPRARVSMRSALVDRWTLIDAWWRVKRGGGSAGPDRISVEHYERRLDANIESLRTRLTSGTYREGPVSRIFLPKPDGGSRAIGIANVEDRVLRTAAGQWLQQLLEPTSLTVASAIGPVEGLSVRPFSRRSRPGGMHGRSTQTSKGSSTTWTTSPSAVSWQTRVWTQKIARHSTRSRRAPRHCEGRALDVGTADTGRRAERALRRSGFVSLTPTVFWAKRPSTGDSLLRRAVGRELRRELRGQPFVAAVFVGRMPLGSRVALIVSRGPTPKHRRAAHETRSRRAAEGN
ncbi:MAG: hypothetical protein ABIP90_05390 [Vicinamibacterales bacterium]